jgi:hypothetical protein
MKVSLRTVFMCIVLALVSCKTRDFGSVASLDKNLDKNFVNPLAFNAYQIWQAGNQGMETKEVLRRPMYYGRRSDKPQPDGVFYMAYVNDFWEKTKGKSPVFVFRPTENARVENDTLTYPAVDGGKPLVLQFSPIAPERMDHLEAMEYCANAHLRLPTIREIFDFCAVGVKNIKYGPDYDYNSDYGYEDTARCKGKDFWSVTLNVDEPENADQRDRNMRAFQFSGSSGAVTFNSRNSGKFEVRCVGLR